MGNRRVSSGAPQPPPPEREPPRVRDLPAPRRAAGMISPLFRRVFAWPYRVALAGLLRAGFRAWQITVLSLVCNVVAGWLLVAGQRFIPGMLLLVAGILDILDGGLARLRGTAGPAGAFLDSVMDRISDVIIFGALYWSLAGQGSELQAALALASLVISLLISQLRAEAEAVGLELTEGFVQRLERYVLLMIGLTAPGALLPVLLLMTVLGGLTVVQRSAVAWRQLSPLVAQPHGPDAMARKVE